VFGRSIGLRALCAVLGLGLVVCGHALGASEGHNVRLTIMRGTEEMAHWDNGSGPPAGQVVLGVGVEYTFVATCLTCDSHYMQLTGSWDAN